MRSTTLFLSALLGLVSLAAVLPDMTTGHQLEKRANCGAGIGSCSGGLCCSKWGYCGSTDEYCGEGCQAGFGSCKTTPPGACGPGKPPCAAGLCCSRYGFCGTSSEYCGVGCQEEFGHCDAGPFVSPDDSCGETSAGPYTCTGSAFGRCCSRWGWCGSSVEYCGAGCQPGFGTCG